MTRNRWSAADYLAAGAMILVWACTVAVLLHDFGRCG